MTWPPFPPRINADTGADEPWLLNDLRKTCATYYDEHVPESSIEILGQSVGGITYRDYAAPCSTGLSGNRDDSATDSVLGIDQRIR